MGLISEGCRICDVMIVSPGDHARAAPSVPLVRVHEKAQEFRDALFLRYGRSPGDLPSHCDGCGQKFTIQHALECKKGGKVILRHYELRDEIGNLAAKAFIPSAIRNEPLIHTSCPAVKMPALDPAHA
mmetsp:Transcript_11535/g.16929  ORF Transcript_11535/g.16929 Transcript_11535/m.16929 type:complete len:128 (+) Transcript_11535:2395-2778(+)